MPAPARPRARRSTAASGGLAATLPVLVLLALAIGSGGTAAEPASGQDEPPVVEMVVTTER